MKLDGVESWGNSEVRRARKAVVRQIEDEASAVEAYWTRAWVSYRDLTTATAMPAVMDESEAEVDVRSEQGSGTTEDVQAEKMQGGGLEEDTEAKYDAGDIGVEEKELEAHVSKEGEIPSVIDSSSITSEPELMNAEDDTIEALPQLYHTDGSDSDADSDFEDVGLLDADTLPAKINVFVASDAESDSGHSLSLMEDKIEMGPNRGSSFGECVMH
jgi:hypothetical protein